jgi:uncharacterized protein
VVRDPWHYPRGELAAQLLQSFTVVDMIAIFAPRRKGKTWFVLRDLSPASIKKDYVPVYASLWRTPDKPHLAILEALKLAHAEMEKKRVPWTEYLSRLSSVSVNVAGIGGGSLGMSRKSEATADELTLMGRLMTDVVHEAKKRKRRVLLLIDEAQHLATSSAFDGTTKSLRTAIEGLRATQPGSIKALFTGSSRTDLAVLLEQQDAAFYQSVDRQELPDLDRAYTNFVADQLARLGKVRVGRDPLWDTFCELEKSPYFMQELIRELMLKRARTLKEARERILWNIRANPEISGRWTALSPLERAVFLRVETGASLYSGDVMKALAEEIGKKGVTSGQVQNVIRQLTKKGYIGATQRRGEYRIEDTELKTWLAIRKDR